MKLSKESVILKRRIERFRRAWGNDYPRDRAWISVDRKGLINPCKPDAIKIALWSVVYVYGLKHKRDRRYW